MVEQPPLGRHGGKSPGGQRLESRDPGRHGHGTRTPPLRPRHGSHSPGEQFVAAGIKLAVA